MRRIHTLLLLALVAFAGIGARAAKIDFRLTVDVADRIVAQTMSTGFISMPTNLPLVDGENTVSAYCESTFNIIAADAQYVITSVTINGAPQNIDDPGRFVFYVPFDFEGSEVVVTTGLAGETPDPDPDPDPNPDPQPQMCSVTFEFAQPSDAAYITGVSIRNEPVPAYLDGFQVEAGTPVEIEINTSLKTDVFTINGQEPVIMVDRVFVTIEENTVVYVALHQDVDYHFTVNIDDASRAEVGYNVVVGTGWFAQVVFTPFELVDGENELTVNEAVATTVVVRAKGDGNVVTAITVDGEPVEVADETAIPLADGLAIGITTQSRTRDAVCTVVCDDPSKVQLTCGTTQVQLTEPTQQVEFFSDTESTFTIAPAGYSDRIWGVELNGVALAPEYGSTYVLTVADGDVINIVTVAPDVAVTFAYADELSRGAISRVTVTKDGYAQEVSDFDGESLTLPMGSYVTVYPNPEMLIEEFTVTGSELLVYPGSYEFSVAGETQVYIKAVEKEKFLVNINAVNAAYVKAYYIEHTTNWLGIPVDKEVTIELAEGANTIALDPVPDTICLTALEGAELTKVEVDGQSLLGGEDLIPETVVSVPVVKDMNIEVTAELLSGIGSVIAPGTRADVYSLQGVRLMRSADASMLRSLAPGVYVIGGRKVFVK